MRSTVSQICVGLAAAVSGGGVCAQPSGHVVEGVLTPSAVLDGAQAAAFETAAMEMIDAFADESGCSTDAQRSRYGGCVFPVAADADGGVQERLVARGLARTAPSGGLSAAERGMQRRWLALENEARKAGRGLWAEADYQVQSAKDLSRFAPGVFSLVEGRVLSAKAYRSVTYVNFGDDYRTDFTVQIPEKVRESFDEDGLTPERLQGARLRVRGWIIEQNGPAIVAETPLQLEFVADDAL